MDPEGRLPTERELRLRLEALARDERVELLRILESTDEGRPAANAGPAGARPHSEEMAEFLTYLERDRAARGVVITELRIMNRRDG